MVSQPPDSDDEKPVSIASLRSKFENMARAPSPAAPAAASQRVTTTSTGYTPPLPPPGRALRPAAASGSMVISTKGASPPPLAAPASVPQPTSSATSSSTAPPSVRKPPPPRPTTLAPHVGTPPRVASPARQVEPVAPSAESVSLNEPEPELEKEDFQTLRQRFGPARTASPQPPRAAPETQLKSEAPASKPPPPPPPMSAAPSVSVVPIPVSAGAPTLLAPKPVLARVAPKPPISRSQSPTVLEPVVPAVPAVPSSPAPARKASPAASPARSRPPPPPPPAFRRQLTEPPATTSRSTSPGTTSVASAPSAPTHRPTPPAPPLPHAASPAAPAEAPPTPAKPPLPTRKPTLSTESSQGSVTSLAPPPLPANRPPAHTATPSPPRPAASPLPQTRSPSSISSELPVPVPPALPARREPTPTSPAPPPLPATKRPPVASATGTVPPPLPTRRATIEQAPLQPPPAAPPLPSNKPQAPALISKTSSPGPQLAAPEVQLRPRAQTVSRDLAPRAAPAPAASPARLPARRVPPEPTEGGDYQPPPPPLRLATVATAAIAASTLQRNFPTGATPTRTTSMHRHGSGDGDSDDEEGGGPQPISSMAQRLLDEHPDSTQANRRPPQFSPNIKVASSQTISSFASHGRFVCVAHSTIKVYDTQMDSVTPILTFDPKDIGLEMRAKEPRVTAMGFRPSTDPIDQGRFLWCGNRDGHVWELDIQSGEITSVKPLAHSGPVTHIMAQGVSMVTLDEVGKMNIWETPEGIAQASYRVVRTQRLSDKVTFAKIIKGHLWAATAPAVRSATNTSAARGPTVRVYDLTIRQIPPPLMALTTEWTGAATSATVLPLDPDHVYMGHEGGFVTRWSIESGHLVCVQVLKVSSTDILSLEGVGDRLWAGNRRGQIHVWNTSERPWMTTNIWTAHTEPVHTLAVDPSSIAVTGRFMLWSVSRDSINAWDGLLAVDWIDKQMVQRQPQYCQLRDVRVLVCSWNIDSAKPTDLIGSVENTTFLEQVLNSVDSPDIIVFGFQEVVPLTDKKLTAKTLLFGHKGKDGGGATNDRVSERYRAWADKLNSAIRVIMPHGQGYTKVHSEQLVGLFTCMFVKTSEREALRDVSIKTVKRGIGGIYGNKGAIVARMVMDDTSICFINVHLAAGQSHRAARTADLAAIMEDKAIFPNADKLPYVNGGDGTAILDHEMVVLNGDLNYRIDQRREVVISSIKSGDLQFLLEHDQLRKEMRKNHAFRLRNFAEPPIHFAPTYKYDQGTNNYDSSDKKRIPAWCDRILFLKNARVAPIDYRRYETTCSDHKPVSCGLTMQIKRIDHTRMRTVHTEVVSDWAKHEANLLPKIISAYEELY